MIFEIGPYTLNVDVEKTRSANSLIDFSNQSCVCNVCQNYTPAILQVDPVVLNFISQFGLDPRKPSKVMGYDVREETMFCGAYYHIVGTIMKAPSPVVIIGTSGEKRISPDQHIKMTEHAEFRFDSESQLVPKGFPAPVLQMEIEVSMPWVMDYLPDQQLPKALTQNVKSDFAKLVDKQLTKRFWSTLYSLKFEIGSENKELDVKEDLFNKNQLGWYGIITYMGKNLLLMNNIKN